MTSCISAHPTAGSIERKDLYGRLGQLVAVNPDWDSCTRSNALRDPSARVVLVQDRDQATPDLVAPSYLPTWAQVYDVILQFLRNGNGGAPMYSRSQRDQIYLHSHMAPPNVRDPVRH